MTEMVQQPQLVNERRLVTLRDPGTAIVPGSFPDSKYG